MISEALQHISFINILFAITVIFVIICLVLLIREIGQFSQVRKENEMLVHYVSCLEHVTDDAIASQHEFKNQLLALKGLLLQKEYDSVSQHLNMALHEKMPSYQKIQAINVLPQGGLKGLIFMQLLEYHDQSIAISFKSKGDLKRLSPEMLSPDIYNHLCRITALFFECIRPLSEKKPLFSVNITLSQNFPDSLTVAVLFGYSELPIRLVWNKKLFQRAKNRIAEQWAIIIEEEKEANTFLVTLHFDNIFTC